MLSQAMGIAAGYTGRIHQLKSIAAGMSESEFYRLANQHPSTLDRDLESAERDFQLAKEAYETHCAEIGEPAYCTYNED